MVKFSVVDLQDFKWDSNEREREESEGIKGEIRGKIKNKTFFHVFQGECWKENSYKE